MRLSLCYQACRRSARLLSQAVDQSIMDLPLPDARSVFITQAMQRVEALLQRPRSAVELQYASGEKSYGLLPRSPIMSRTCRIVGTDTYVPYTQTVMTFPHRQSDQANGLNATSNIFQSVKRMKIKRAGSAISLVDKLTQKSVDVTWTTMDPSRQNVVTVGDALGILPVTAVSPLDLLRFYLTSGVWYSFSGKAYWSDATFREYSPVCLKCVYKGLLIFSYHDRR